MFENSDFQIYETLVRLRCEAEKMKKLNRHLLQIKETLDAIKEKDYESVEHTID